MFLNTLINGITYNGQLSKSKIARIDTDRLLRDIMVLLINEDMNNFEYNFPPTCDPRYIEYNFLLRGRACVIDADGGYLSLGVSDGGNVNMYDRPTNAFAHGANGFIREFKPWVRGADEDEILLEGVGGEVNHRLYDGVIGYDNTAGYPYIEYIYDFAKRLTDVLRATDVAVQNLKQPMIVQCEPGEEESVKRALNQKESNVSAVVGVGGTIERLNSFHVWPTGVNPDALPALKAHYEWLWGVIQNIMGEYTNPQPDKTERLVVAEATSNRDIADAFMNIRLDARLEWCDNLNEAFPDWDWRIELKHKKEESNVEGMFDEDEEGGNDEQNAE